MARFDPKHQSLDYASLKDSVVVLTGGASGIGAATVHLLHSYGAKVIFGDLDAKGADLVVSSTSPDSVHYLKTDVRSYQDNLALFKLAYSKYGRVDHAIANAGLIEKPGWFAAKATVDDLEKEPDMTTVDVNLKGVMYFAHIACTYLAQGGASDKNKSLTLLSSVAGFKETPGLFAYQCSKHGVLGLMRTLRLYLPNAFPGIRVNAICPSMTETRMTVGIREDWIGGGNPVNLPEDVARMIVGVTAAGPGTEAIWYDEKDSPGFKERENMGQMDWEDKKCRGTSGRALYVMGGESYDIEEGLDRTERDWLGVNISGLLKKAQAGLGEGENWVD